MKLKNIFLLLFLFFMIAVTIFFSSSPFSIVKDYTCKNVTIQNQSARVCGPTEQNSNLEEVITILQNAPLSNESYEVNTLSIVQNGTMCSYNDETKCMGQTITNGRIEGTQYLVKQVYLPHIASCTANVQSTFYYSDCTVIPKNVCSASRCVSSPWQLRFYKLMQLLGFSP